MDHLETVTSPFGLEAAYDTWVASLQTDKEGKTTSYDSSPILCRTAHPQYPTTSNVTIGANSQLSLL